MAGTVRTLFMQQGRAIDGDAIAGDFNGDGVLNILDVVMLVGYILNGVTIDEVGYEYDTNADQVFNVLDVVQLVQWIINGVEE